MAVMATVILSRHPGTEANQQRFEEDLIAELRTAAVRLVLVPHVYYLTPGDPASVRLRQLVLSGTRVTVAGWLHPRALRWTLAALGCDLPADRVTDLRTFTSVQECAAHLAAGVGADRGQAVIEDLGPGRAGRWYPVIDRDRCTGCKQCLDFCLFGVYSPGASSEVLVTQPDNCKPGCPACARVCPTGAIMFPEYAGSATIAGSPDATGETPTGPAMPTETALTGRPPAAGSTTGNHDELDDLIDALDDLDQD